MTTRIIHKWSQILLYANMQLYYINDYKMFHKQLHTIRSLYIRGIVSNI